MCELIEYVSERRSSSRRSSNSVVVKVKKAKEGVMMSALSM